VPRPKSLQPMRKVHIALPEALMARLDLHVVSMVEGRVPQGAYQRFFTERLVEFFGKLDSKENLNV